MIGPAWGMQTFVRIRWVWISAPAFLLLATLAFVVGTIVKSSRQQVEIWKTSALAMLLHGLAGGARHKLDPGGVSEWSGGGSVEDLCYSFARQRYFPACTCLIQVFLSQLLKYRRAPVDRLWPKDVRSTAILTRYRCTDGYLSLLTSRKLKINWSQERRHNISPVSLGLAGKDYMDMSGSLRVCWLEVDAESEINILVPTGLFLGIYTSIDPTAKWMFWRWRETKLETYDGWKILYSNILPLAVHYFYYFCDITA